MMDRDKMTKDECVSIYSIEIAFLDSLEESGLIHLHTEDAVQYVLYDEIPLIERFVNWHYDMEVNLPGLEIIHRLLQKVEQLQAENKRLLRQAGQLS